MTSSSPCGRKIDAGGGPSNPATWLTPNRDTNVVQLEESLHNVIYEVEGFASVKRADL
jgi:hypothetical protein